MKLNPDGKTVAAVDLLAPGIGEISSYYNYLAGGKYDSYPVWCSSPTLFPLLPQWDFWQYSHSARLEGYHGAQPLIDLNVFRGSKAQFEAFGLG